MKNWINPTIVVLDIELTYGGRQASYFECTPLDDKDPTFHSHKMALSSGPQDYCRYGSVTAPS